MQLFTHLRSNILPIAVGTGGQYYFSWTPAMKKTPVQLYHCPKDGDISLGRPPAPFNCLNIMSKVDGETLHWEGPGLCILEVLLELGHSQLWLRFRQKFKKSIIK